MYLLYRKKLFPLCLAFSALIICSMVMGCVGNSGIAKPAISNNVEAVLAITGHNISLKAAALGTAPFSYQWFNNGVSISGATGDTYSFSPSASDDGADLSVMVSNPAGSSTEHFILTVQVPPSIVAQPRDTSVQMGSEASLTVAAIGTSPLTYQWFRNHALIPGANGEMLRTGILEVVDTGTAYSVEVTNPAGSIVSGDAHVTIVPGQPSLKIDPIGTKTYGDVPFTLGASSTSPGPITFQVVSGPATVTGSVLTITGAGTVIVLASQNAVDSYSGASSVTTFEVVRQVSTIAFDPLGAKALDDVPFVVTARSSSPAPIAYVVRSGPARISGSTVTVTGVGAVTLEASQTETENFTASDRTASFVVGPPMSGSSSIPTGNILKADSFPGSDPATQINTCLAHMSAIGGGTCDARMYNGGVQMSAQINVLPSTVLRLPAAAEWFWDLRDGTSVGMMQYTGSSIIGTAPGGGGGDFYLMPGSNATKMLALYATDGAPADGGSYIYATGFGALNLQYQGAQFSHGLIYTRFLWDESRIERVTAGNLFGDAWHIYGVCCDTEFAQVQAASNYGTLGGTPLVIENAVGTGHGSAVRWSGTVNAAGNGHPNIDIQDGNWSVDFPELYAETNEDKADTSTAIIQIETTTSHSPIVRIQGGMVSRSTNKPCFSIPAAYAPLDGFENHNWCGAGSAANTTLVNSTLNSPTIVGGNAALNSLSSNWIGLSTTPLAQEGQIAAGSVIFTPTQTGWYRVFSGRYLQGTFDIHSDDPERDVIGMVTQGWYASPANITILNTGMTLGGHRIVTQVATSALDRDGVNYLDIYVADASLNLPVSVTFTGQGIPNSGIIKSPTVGTGPTNVSVAKVDLTNVDLDANFPSVVSTGGIGAAKFTGGLSTPQSSSAVCNPGQFWDDANYHYVCVAKNSIKRVALTDF
jgi:hypothetical protein